MMKDFEFRFKRTERLPCNQVKDYPARLAEEDPVSDDELDIGHYQDRALFETTMAQIFSDLLG